MQLQINKTACIFNSYACKNTTLSLFRPIEYILRTFYVQETFELNEKYKVDRRILKCDFVRCLASQISRVNTAISQK